MNKIIIRILFFFFQSLYWTNIITMNYWKNLNFPPLVTCKYAICCIRNILINKLNDNLYFIQCLSACKHNELEQPLSNEHTINRISYNNCNIVIIIRRIFSRLNSDENIKWTYKLHKKTLKSCKKCFISQN